MVGGAGNNLLVGSPGDTLDYAVAPHGMTLDFQAGIAFDNGYGGTDTIVGFTRVIGAEQGGQYDHHGARHEHAHSERADRAR
ncbi:MAG: hypothetical protein WDO24_03700 [Pseudomonadota bacterium]